MSFLPSASKLPLARHCVFPWTGGVRWPKLPPSTFATFGTAVSQVAECCAIWGKAPVEEIADANGLTPSARTDLHHAEKQILNTIQDFDPAWVRAEVPLAYHVARGRGRELARKHHRDYSQVRDGELVGTPDLVFGRDDALFVVDWKTGRYRAGAEPRADGQLRALALFAARAYGFDEVMVSFAQVDPAGVWVTDATLDELDLLAVREELRTIVGRIGKPQSAVPEPGQWCRGNYCPIVAGCPATAKTLAAVEAASELGRPFSVEIQSAEHAAWTLERVEAAAAALEQIKAAVKEFARHTPIPCADGKVYMAREQERQTINLTPEAMVVLGKYSLTDAVDTSIKKAGIKRAIKASAPRGKASAIERQLMAELEAIGCVRTSNFVKFERGKPPAEDQ